MLDPSWQGEEGSTDYYFNKGLLVFHQYSGNFFFYVAKKEDIRQNSRNV